ncbi:MAG: UDP-N-acetylmuramoyl-L-alanine--D-glutamate ligase, partial [Chitinophagaceae bacterium]
MNSLQTSITVPNTLPPNGKRLVILGSGESGVGAAILGKLKGYDVFVSDGGKLKPIYKTELEQYGIAYEEGCHSADLILNASEIVKSPGIPEKNELIKT